MSATAAPRTWAMLPALAASALCGLLLLTGKVSLDAYWTLIAGAALIAAVPALLGLAGAGGTLGLVLISTTLIPPVAGGSNASLALALAACGAWGLHGLSRRRTQLARERAVVALLAFLAVTLIAFVVGQYPWFPADHAPMRAQLGGLAIFVASGGLFLAVGHQVQSIDRLRRLTWIFVALGGFFVVQQSVRINALAALNGLTQPDDVGSLFWTWFAAVTIAQAAFNAELPGIWRVALLALGALAIFRGLFVAFDWVSGWLPPLVAVGVIALWKFPRLTLCSAAIAAAPMLAVGSSVVDRLVRGESYSLMTRLEAVGVVAQVLQRNPFLGFGPANYYEYTQLFPILGWWVRFNSHNNYLDIVAQTGVIGLAAFLWFGAEAAVIGYRVGRTHRNGFTKAFAIGALAGLAGSLVAGALADWIVPFAYNIGIRGFRSSLLFWFFLGGLLAIARITPRGETGAANALTTP